MRILIGWELGSNQGHLTCIRQLANHLKLHGHELFIVVKPEANAPESIANCPTICGPAWTRAATAEQRPQPASASMGHILASSGLFERGVLKRVIGEWRKLFQQFQPDVVIGEYAPALLCAARGRIKSISVGTGFTSPPSMCSAFPVLNPDGLHQGESDIVREINKDLRSSGDGALEALPAIFKADTVLLATWPELDPYHALRSTEYYVHPSTSSILPDVPGANGDEIFVYSYNTVHSNSMFWKAVVAPGYPVRVHVRDASPEHLLTFRSLDIQFEAEPVGFDRIARNSRLVLSHGGHGTICTSMLAGLPILCAALDLEKSLNGNAAARMGIGLCIPFAGSAIQVAKALSDLWSDCAIADRSRNCARSLRLRQKFGLAESVSNAISGLI